MLVYDAILLRNEKEHGRLHRHGRLRLGRASLHVFLVRLLAHPLERNRNPTQTFQPIVPHDRGHGHPYRPREVADAPK